MGKAGGQRYVANNKMTWNLAQFIIPAYLPSEPRNESLGTNQTIKISDTPFLF